MFVQTPVTRRFYGPRQIDLVVVSLLKRSCWIEVTPLPEDLWEVAVKSEAAHNLPDPATLPPEAFLSVKDIEGLGYQLREDGPDGFRHYWVNAARQSNGYHTTQANAQDDAIEDAADIYNLHRCDDCGRLHTDETLQAVKDMAVRVAAGDPMPSGECECGALCYPIEIPS
jgi:hypothetical protein